VGIRIAVNMDARFGKIHVYTGDTKGKTTTAMGMALRAVGQNLNVAIIQFLKGGAYTGEYRAIKQWLPQDKITIVQYGKPCVQDREVPSKHPECLREQTIAPDINCGTCRVCFVQDEEAQEYVNKAYVHARQAVTSGEYDLIILDEINNSVASGLLTMQDIHALLAQRENTELIFTGRNAHPELIKCADLVTEMKEVKHYFQKGIMARRGVEY
jgi:cob(I)alamin adenosyltransferase